MMIKGGKVLVFGNFGYETNQFCGQTIKTRDIYSLLKSKEDITFSNVSYFDTQIFQKSKFYFIKALRAAMKADVIYYLAAMKNLTYIFPFVFIISKLFKIDIHFIVIGGWLDEFLIKKPIHKSMLSRVKGIYPETRELTESLKEMYAYKNVHQLHNFRIVESNKKVAIETKSDTIIQLVFIARVHPLKGVETLFKLGEELQRRNIVNVEIDIYGPIFDDYDKEFNRLLLDSKFVKYKGVLQPDEINKTLANYDLMLFPTQYYTEGFPGTILDSYMAGVPVVATDWKFANEFVINNKSGIVTEFDNVELFINETINLTTDVNRIFELQEGVKDQRNKYSSEMAWEILKNNL